MSGLEKFEASESWRSNIKKFLFIERKATLKKPVTVRETHRCSLDIAEDLQNLIKERKIQIELEKQTPIKSLQSTGAPSSGDTMSCSTPHFDDTCYGAAKDLPLVEKVSDESFEAVEKMCDKTASDPNSTLFQYLHSDHQEQVLADAKKRNSGDGNSVGREETDSDSLLAKFSDCTLLDDIEAPSRIWENTVVADTVLMKTSPVKMVGLLRPSTIMEEAGDESANSDISSQMSFQTATKGFPSDVSSIYDTALESTVTSTRTDMSNKRRKDEEINVDGILELAIERCRELVPGALPLSNIFVSEPIKTTDTTSANENTSDVKEMPIDLIDLEKTFAMFHNSPHSSMLGDTAVDIVEIDDDEERSESEDAEVVEDESIIDILSDEEEIEDCYSDMEQKDMPHNSLTSDSYDFDNGTFEDNKENVTQSLSCDRSMKFNDTMEEVEYMLKKGMEYMAAMDLQTVQPATKCVVTTHVPPLQTLPLISPVKPIYPSKPQPKPTAQLRTCRTQLKSPLSNLRKPAQGSGSVTKGSTVTTPAKSTQTPSNCLPIGMRPFPKFDVFGGRSPKNIPCHPRQKELASKQPFSHIVSPVGAYMKKTAYTPLMSTSKLKNANSNVINSRAFRELEYESRLYEPKFEISSPSTQCGSGLSALPGLTGTPQTLPKKAYISSELKHIVDERTPFTIPGGKKIQKYLENAMMPAVLRHDGKMKFPGPPNVPSTTNTFSKPSEIYITKSQPTNVGSVDMNAPITTPSTRRNNASLADLSVMSGDVSMYTIMDAQKF